MLGEERSSRWSPGGGHGTPGPPARPSGTKEKRLPRVPNPAPPPPRVPTLPGWRVGGGGDASSRRGSRDGAVRVSLYHGGGGGGGPCPGVCGSPPRSRARRFHFPGCPRVNIRVSAPSPLPRRAAATILPRPGQPGPPPTPPARGQ